MDKPTVMCVMPTREAPMQEARASMDLAANTYGCPVAVHPGQPRDFNRNRAVQFFLDQPRRFDYLLFVDDDTVIPADAIAKLLAVRQPVVCGVQPLWLTELLVANVKLLDGPEGPSAWPDWVTWARPPESFRIGFCGFGCVLIERRVLETIPHPRFVEQYGDVWGKNNQTEDVDFNLKCIAAGFETWCEPTVVCGHLKRVNLLDWVPRKQIQLRITRPTTVGE